jgi:hypothetical protein
MLGYHCDVDGWWFILKFNDGLWQSVLQTPFVCCLNHRTHELRLQVICRLNSSIKGGFLHWTVLFNGPNSYQIDFPRDFIQRYSLGRTGVVMRDTLLIPTARCKDTNITWANSNSVEPFTQCEAPKIAKLV